MTQENKNTSKKTGAVWFVGQETMSRGLKKILNPVQELLDPVRPVLVTIGHTGIVPNEIPQVK